MCKGLEVGNACVAGGIGECLEMRLRRIDQVQRVHSFHLCFSTSVPSVCMIVIHMLQKQPTCVWGSGLGRVIGEAER